MQKITFMLVGAIGAVLLGLPYIFGAFGPTETEVGIWGIVSLGIGVILGFLCLGIGHSNHWISKAILALGYIFLILLQILPIILWFEFHGLGISDGTPASAFVAHWGYSILHIALVIISLTAIFVIFRSKSRFAY